MNEFKLNLIKCVFVRRHLFVYSLSGCQTSSDCGLLVGVTMHTLVSFQFHTFGARALHNCSIPSAANLLFSILFICCAHLCGAAAWMRSIQLKLIVLTGPSMRSYGIDAYCVRDYSISMEDTHLFINLWESRRDRVDAVAIKSFNFLKSDFWLWLARAWHDLVVSNVNFIQLNCSLDGWEGSIRQSQ